ncbi:hypothetical protein AGMMS49975_28670 [Clostridia bacterium]|nr:hypothetical protein AGMMS49975_28670 [Clostridia bacterium]
MPSIYASEIDPRIPVYIISDEQRLAQVVTNLLANAVKFTPEYGKIYLKAELEEITGGECVIRVSVKDTGIGISEEQQQQLFKSFQQADTGISRRFGGTGLGLAISKNIVELMNGKIWIESELEKGAAFIFRIKAKIKTLETRAWDWKGINAVVAEDSAGSTGYAADILEMYGASCASFGDPQDALDFIASNKTDIVIIDMSLKGMNGFEFSKRLMSAEKKMRAVIVSNADNSEYAEELSALGIDSFLQKPILPKALSVFINDYLRRGAEAEDDDAACEIENVFEGKHALIAEDVDVNREIIQTITEDMGLRITFAADGAQAVRTFENTRGFDIILMDINMPNMDGHTAARRIREIERERGYAPAPIMAMTANVFREDIEKCLESGMNDHLGKPLDIEELYRKLKKHLLN